MSVILDPSSGHGLSQEHSRVAELISEYEPSLELAWVPPDQRQLNEEFPFAIIHRPVGLEPYVVMRLRESEVDHRVIGRLAAADQTRGNTLDAIEVEEAARRELVKRRQEDERQEAKEFAAWAVAAKTGAKHNGVRYV